MGHFMESKVLALTTISLLISLIILIVSGCLPFWFKLHISTEDGSYGSEARRENYVIPCGLFFITSDMHDMVFLNKISNHMFAPKTIVIGQVMYISGTIGIMACLAASFILACRKIGSVVGEFFLAGFTTASSVCVILGVLLSAVVFLNMDDNVWNKLPLNNPERISGVVRPTSIEVDWAFFIAIIGAVISIISVVMIWLEALKTCRYIEEIRDNQLRNPDYGKHDEVPYTKFSYEQTRPKPYEVTIPSARPMPPDYYGEPQISQQVEI